MGILTFFPDKKTDPNLGTKRNIQLGIPAPGQKSCPAYKFILQASPALTRKVQGPPQLE